MPISTDNPLQLPLFHFNLLQSHSPVAHAIATRHVPGQPLFREFLPEYPDDYRTAGPARYHRQEVIAARRSEMLTALGLDYRQVQPNLVGVRQVHSARVVAVGDEAYGAELNWMKPLADADGIVTDQPGVPLMTIHADCPPVLLYDPVRRVIGAVHSGWRGTVGKICLAAVQLMHEKYGSRPGDILAGIGPGIGPCCYQVAEPVLSAVEQAFTPVIAAELLPEQPDGSSHFDLWQALYLTLREAGLPAPHIEQSRLCTMCHNRDFFSYRATPPELRHDYGQFTALIVLR